jgi:CRP/FNR family transcriptional regulator
MPLSQYLSAQPKTTVSCASCNLSKFCIPRELDTTDTEALNRSVRRNRLLRKGESLYVSGEWLQGIFALKSGTAKLVSNDPQGNEHIVDFLVPGELLGFDGLATQRHTCSAVALETVSYCELPARHIDTLAREAPNLLLLLLQHSGSQSNRNMQHLVLSRHSAEKRLAAFLVHLSERYRQRGFSPYEFRITMTRQEIGNYLGLALETVSRWLGQFESAGLIVVRTKLIRIRNLDGLLEYFRD